MSETTNETTNETSGITIKCNNVPRQLIYGYELTDKQKAEFDYLTEEELDTNSFVAYKGNIYDLSQFMAINRHQNQCYSPKEFAGFDGYHSDSFFSGILIKYCSDNEFVIMATYYS